MLLQYGIGKQSPNWHVLETKPSNYIRMYYILGGDSTYYGNGITQKLLPGWFYIFPSHTPYEITTSPSDPIDCLFLQQDIRGTVINQLVARNAAELPLFHDLITTLKSGIVAQSSPDYIEDLSNAFEKLCFWEKLFTPVDPDTQRFLDALDRTYRDNIPLSEIAAQFGYSTEHFIRLFRDRVGIPPYQHILRLRMTHAIRLLASGKRSIQEIALAIGYNDNRSFSNAFKNFYGISPSTYRRFYVGKA